MRRRTLLLRHILTLLFACVFAGAASADQISLKNGDRISGAIVKSDSKVLLIKTEFAGDVTVKWEAISAIESTQPLHLALKDGQTIVGVVKTEDGKLEVAAKETGNVSAPVDSVVAIRNDAEQKTFDEEAERLRHPHLTDFWTGMLDTGLSLTRGNSSTLAYTLAGKAVRETPRDKFTVYTSAVYGRDSSTPPARTIAHAIHGGIRGDLNLTERIFVFGLTDFDYDALQHLDLRNVLGGGAGYHVVDTKVTKFDLFAGVAFNQEYFGAYPNPALPSGIQPAISRKSAELLAGEELSMKLNTRTTLAERFSFFPNVSHTGDFRMQFDATATTKLKNWLGWQMTFSDRYISNPPPLLKGNDLVLSTGLRVNFGKGTL
jgi:putative salt-induced outer membrane protein YdiY